jgi:site-specific recombinase XerD
VPAVVARTGANAVAEYRAFVLDRRRTPDTRKNYRLSVTIFFAWCEQQKLSTLTSVQPDHVLGWFAHRCQEVSASTAIAQTGHVRMLFDQFVHWWVIPMNPVPSPGRLRLAVRRYVR